MNLLTSRKIQIAIIVALTTLVYSNIFANDFAIDDGDFIFNWPAVRSFDNIGKVLTTESVPEDHAGVYRPVKALFLMVNIQVWQWRPFGYHLFSILVHLANTTLVYLIVQSLISADLKSRLAPMSIVKWLPFIVGLLFGLHPVHVEAVTFILASFDAIGLTFYLLAFWMFLVAKGERRKAKWLRIGSVVFAILGFFTYELALTLPAVIVLYEFCLRQTRIIADPSTTLRTVVKSRLARMNTKLILVRTWPYWAGLAIYLAIRFFVLDIAVRGEYLGGSFYNTALVMTRAFTKYLEILSWPAFLSIDHKIFPGIFSVVYLDFVNSKTLESLTVFYPPIFLSILTLASLLIISIKLLRKWPIISFGILWFFVTLAPVSYMLPQSSIFSERYAYLASFGFVLILGFLLVSFYRRFKVLSTLILIFILIFYSMRTFVRNRDWKDTLAVWQKLVQDAPDNPVANYTVAKIYAERGDNKSAIQYFSQALSINPDIVEVNFRLGKIYLALGNIDLAENYLQKAAAEDNARYFFMAKRELGKIAYIRANGWPKNQELFRQYELESRVNFDYPASWMVTKFDKGVAFDDLLMPFSVELYMDQVKSGENFSLYLARQPDHFGKLVGEGAAQVPNVEEAYVKVWKDEEVDKLEFFLRDNDVVLKILVYPTNSSKMADFDRLLSSIEID